MKRRVIELYGFSIKPDVQDCERRPFSASGSPRRTARCKNVDEKGRLLGLRPRRLGTALAPLARMLVTDSDSK